MEWSQEFYDELKQKQNDGLLTDPDERRMLKEMERQGFQQSRLKRERDARNAAMTARTSLSSVDGEEDVSAAPGARDEKLKWITFAETVNAKLAEDERPIPDPRGADVTKADLVAAYKNYAGAGADE